MSYSLDITALPSLDLSLLAGRPQQRRKFLDELRHAARDVMKHEVPS